MKLSDAWNKFNEKCVFAGAGPKGCEYASDRRALWGYHYPTDVTVYSCCLLPQRSTGSSHRQNTGLF